jgi:hypothetical protein
LAQARIGLAGKGSRKLEEGAAVERLEAAKAELADPLGCDLAAGGAGLALDAVGDRLERARVDLALVRGAHERAPELAAVEGLAAAAALDHHDRLAEAALERGEALAAAPALAPAPDRGAAVGGAGLERARGAVAGGTVHLLQSTTSGVSVPLG